MKIKSSDESLMYPPLEELLERIPLKFELVLAATRRAKQIIRQQRLNPTSAEIELKGRKPLSIALEDILEERVDMHSLLAMDIELDAVEEEELDMFPDLPYPDRDQDEGFAGEDGTGEDGDEDDEDLGLDEFGDIDVSELNWEKPED
jgi:DNA-directed RNA polymerase omega subunit